MSYTNGTQTQSQSMNGLLEINTDTISASSITTNDLTATDGTVDTLTVVNTINGTITNATNAVNSTNASKIGVDTTTTNASHYLTFVNNITGTLFPYVSSYLSFNPITQMLTSTNATINGTDDSSSLATGALRVLNGGMSVAKDFFLGGSMDIAGALTVNGEGSSFTNELSVGDLIATDGINGGSLSVSNGASVGADLTLGGGITSPFIICNDAVNYTLQYSIIQYNESSATGLNVYF